MRALRACAAILLAGLVAAGGTRMPGSPAPDTTEVCGEAATGIGRVMPPPSSHAFLAASPVASLPAAAQEGARTQSPPTRSLHSLEQSQPIVPAARIAAVARDRLDFAHSLDVARLGWFSFGSTAPPPFRA